MTQEEIQLLLKDLCARLPYGVICRWEDDGFSNIGELTDICHQETNEGFRYWDGFLNFGGEDIPIELIKPYLRPMSSMTEKETEEYRNLSDEVIGSYGPYHHEFIAHCVRLGIKPDNPHECVDDFLNMEAIDWLNAHQFDYRGLISMGLALEAKEGMYKND